MRIATKPTAMHRVAPASRRWAVRTSGGRTSRPPCETPGRRLCRGFVWAEVVISIPIIALLVALSAAGLTQYYRFRCQATARQAAAWAAAAQLQRYQAGAALGSSPPPGMLSAEITLKTVAKPGQGQWQGFQLVTVTAAYSLADRQTVREQISGYIRSAKPLVRESLLAPSPAGIPSRDEWSLRTPLEVMP
jgi:type II secretory pathway pseudopilin PulG